MASPININVQTILYAHPRDIAQHLRDVLSASSVDQVTTSLLHKVERGAVPPTVFTVWLGVSKSPDALRVALSQATSVEIRKIGIKRLKKNLKGRKWKDTWLGLAGVQGLLDVLADLSVQDVRAVCMSLGKIANPPSADSGSDLDGLGLSTEEVQEKRNLITQLLEAILPGSFPDASTGARRIDGRPLRHYYQQLAPACTPEFVARLLTGEMKGDWGDVRRKNLLCYHSSTLRDLALDKLLQNEIGKGKVKVEWVWKLFREYPPKTGLYARFSASMQFSANVLTLLADERAGGSALSEQDFLGKLVLPLLKRCMRKRVAFDKTQDITRLAVAYLQRHFMEERGATNERRRLLHMLALCWSRRAAMFEKQFDAMLRLCYKDVEWNKITLGGFESLMQGVTKSRRYVLLRHALSVVTGRDMERLEDLRWVKGTLTWSLLEKLGAEEALGLYTRLRKARGDHELVQRGPKHSVTWLETAPNGNGGDPNLFHIALLARNGNTREAEDEAKKHIEDRKNKATTSSDQAQRAWYARSVLYYAYASGSLRLVTDTLLWARRFNRDTLTLATLYEHYPDEAKAVFSGLPTPTTPANTDLPTVKHRIEEANGILKILFNNAVETLREPSFNRGFWVPTIKLFLEAVLARMERSPDLRNLADFDEDMIYSAVWQSTVQLITYIDSESLKPGHEKLQLNGPGGILTAGKNWYGSDTCSLNNHYPSTYRFLDELAKARDEIWRRHRIETSPAVMGLPEPYPRGLPIQFLTGPLFPRTAKLDEYAPYLARRARDVVFMDPAVACQFVPSDEETREAIGAFVDDYWYALLIMIPDVVVDSEEGKRRVDAAWNHATGVLSAGRMSAEEADRYWRYSDWTHYVQTWPRLEHLNRNEKPMQWPVVPDVSDPIMVEEWDPRPAPSMLPQFIGSRSLETATYIDLAKNASIFESSREVAKLLKDYRPNIPGRGRKEAGIWSENRCETAKGQNSPRMREGQILSAVLYLDSTNLPDDRLLARPFPNPEDVRYPSLYLDDQFLGSKDTSVARAFQALEAHTKYIPPPLLEQLAKNALAKLAATDTKSAQSIEIQEKAFRLVKLLGKSDRPSLATKLAVGAIMRHPDASSWHRQILSPAVFRRLSASAARSCFESFATEILKTLEQQERAKKEAAERRAKASAEGKEEKKPEGGDAKTANTPFVKITTVKFLAQLLRDTEFVTEEFSVSVLSTLAQKPSHIDIKQAVLDSLLNMLVTAPLDLAQKIFDALEGIIPMAGTLNERRPISEADWQAAQENGTVPEIEITGQESAPMLTTLVNFLQTLRTKGEYKGEYTTRILLPLLVSLKSAMKRWISVFLASSYIPEELRIPPEVQESIPLLPRNVSVWTTLLQKNFSHTPVSVFEEYVNYQLFCIQPPEAVVHLSNHMKSTPELRSNTAVQTFLSLYPLGPSILSSSHISPTSLPSLLQHTPVPPANEEIPETAPEITAEDSSGPITAKSIQKSYLHLFTATLWADTPTYPHLSTLLAQIRPSGIHALNKHWLAFKKPLVEAIILYVEGLRTREWERDVNRQPQVLPDMFELRLWLLKYPGIEGEGLGKGKDQDQEGRCRMFAEQVEKMIEGLASTLYHYKLGLIKDVLKKFVTGTDRLYVALALGDISKGRLRLSWLSMQDVLRVEVAVELVKGTPHAGSEELRERIKGLVGSWRLAGDEGVRRLGYSVTL